MPVIFNVRHLEKHSLHLQGELPVTELDLDGLDECVKGDQPLKYDLDIHLLDGSFLIQGKLEMLLECTCVRCLKEFPQLLELGEWACHLARQGEECVAVVNDCVDLTPYIREDILLAFPQHPLCEPGCDKLPRSAFSGQKNPSKGIGSESSTWAELNKLKFN